MKRLIIFLLLFAAIKVAGQTTGYLRFDTVRIFKQGGTCELYIINKTKDSTGGVLTNIGGGLTSFKKSRINGDTLFVGGDTVNIGILDTAVNVGSGVGFFKLKSGDSLVFKSATEGYGINLTSNTNDIRIEVDTGQVATPYDLTQINDFYTANGTFTSPRTGTQNGNFVRFQDGIDYTQFDGGKTTVLPDSSGSSFVIQEVKSPFAGAATDGILSWYDGFGFASQSPRRPNYPKLRGFNLSMGGANAVVNVAAIGESIEPHYRPDPIGGTPWLMEWHDFYITPQGKQVRMKSYTINTGTNFIDYYMTLGNWRLLDTAGSAWLASSRDIAMKTAQLFLLSTELGHGLAITADSINTTVNFQPANSLTNTSLMADQWKNWTIAGHFFDATGFTSPGHIGEFNIFRTSSQAKLNFKSTSNTRGYILTDDATGFMDYQCQATYEMRWLEGASERMRLLTGGKLMIGTTGATDNHHPRKLYVNGSIGANKDSITLQTTNSTRQMLTIDTATGKFERMDIPAGGGGGSDGNGIYSGSGSLSGNTIVSGGGSNSLTLGASGSKLSSFVVNSSGNASIISDARIFLTGNITYQTVNHNTDANLTVAANTAILELSSGSLTADRTITLPTAATHGQVFTIVVRSTSSANHYVLSSAVPDVKTGTTFTQLEYGTTYDFMVNSSISWMLIRKY